MHSVDARKLTCLSLLAPMLCLVSSVLIADTFVRFEHLTIEDGLAQNSATQLIQDQSGYVWFGTEDGLHRYDGYNFRVFRKDVEDQNSLSHSHVISLAEDADGHIWAGTQGGGLNRVNPATEDVERINFDGEGVSEGHSIVFAVHVDTEEGVWAGTDDGLLYRPPDGDQFRKLETSDELTAPVLAIEEVGEGRIIVGTRSGIGKATDKRDALVRALDHEAPEAFREEWVAAFAASRAGGFWAAAPGKLLYQGDDGTSQIIEGDELSGDGLPDQEVRGISKDQEGNLWLASYGGGLWRVSAENGESRQFRQDPARPQSLSDEALLDVMVDSSGLIWVGTESTGISRLNPQSLRFGHHGHHPLNENSLPHPVIWSLEQGEDETLLVGTEDGLGRIDLTSNEVSRFGPRPEDREEGLWNHFIYNLHKDEAGTIWIGTFTGLWYLPADAAPGDYFERPEMDETVDEIIDSLSVFDSTEIDGSIYFSAHEGIFRRTPDGAWEWIVPPRNKDTERSAPSPLGQTPVFGLQSSRDEHLWLGTDRGLYLYDPDEDRILETYNAENNSLSHDTVMGMVEDGDDYLWVAGLAGLDRIARENGERRRYTTEDGLPSNMVYSVIRDLHGHIWAGTPQGLARLDPDSGSVVVFDARDGLQSNEFNAGAVLALPDGRLGFGGLNGINLFDPQDLDVETPEPPVRITRADLDGRFRYDLPDNDEPLVIGPETSSVSFEFAVLDFRNPARNQFEYKLEGFDDVWRRPGTLNRATFTNLPPGEYRFQVLGANSLGVWNRDGTSLDLIIEPPLWRTGYAYAFYVVLVSSMIGFLLLMYQRRRAREEALNRERERRHWAESLHQLTARIADSLEPSTIADRLFDSLGGLVQADAMTLWQEKDGLLQRVGESGPSHLTTPMREIPRRLQEVCSAAERTGVPQHLDGAALRQLGFGEEEVNTLQGMVAPLRASGVGFGVLAALRSGRAFSAQETGLIMAAGTQGLVSLEKADLFLQVEELASTDGLTGLYNRRHFEELVRQELERNRRYSRNSAILLVDLDRFKQINDRHGHEVGDLCLQVMARTLVEEFRRSDIIARYGGEEFIVFLPETTTGEAEQAAERLRARVEAQEFVPDAPGTRVTASVGVAYIRAGDTRLDEHVRRADEALYKAKDAGRNRVSVASTPDEPDD